MRLLSVIIILARVHTQGRVIVVVLCVLDVSVEKSTVAVTMFCWLFMLRLICMSGKGYALSVAFRFFRKFINCMMWDGKKALSQRIFKEVCILVVQVLLMSRINNN